MKVTLSSVSYSKVRYTLDYSECNIFHWLRAFHSRSGEISFTFVFYLYRDVHIQYVRIFPANSTKLSNSHLAIVMLVLSDDSEPMENNKAKKQTRCFPRSNSFLDVEIISYYKDNVVNHIAWFTLSTRNCDTWIDDVKWIWQCGVLREYQTFQFLLIESAIFMYERDKSVLLLTPANISFPSLDLH